MNDNSFSNSEHALACGIILGAMLKANGEDDLVQEVRPFYDSESNYTNQMLVQIGDRHYTVTVDEALAEAMRSDEEEDARKPTSAP